MVTSQNNSDLKTGTIPDDKKLNDNAKQNVIMNGITWDEKARAEFKNIYKMDPIPGNYWYDAVMWFVGKCRRSSIEFYLPRA
jgi:hypothetical protein